MMESVIQRINGSPMFAGIMMLLLNVGSRYITHEMSDDEEEYHQNILLRRIAVFAVCFVGTRDILLSILLTAGFVILAGGLFRGKGEASREGMKNPDLVMRAAAGLAGSVDSPAHDSSAPVMFK
jgi:hypothetical protein